MLLEAGACIEAMDKRGNTPLLIATSRGAESCVEVLAKHGASLTAINKQGQDAQKLVLAAAKPK